LVNTYGPTETTIVATMCSLNGGDAPESATRAPIGKPVANRQVYVLGPRLEPAPVGVPGELYIGGEGLARGYLRKPELTAQAFIPDPFSGVEGARLYKTGDRVRYLSDGNVEYLGRVDDQVKIRGFRVELGEIETVLRQYPKVQEAVVLAREDIPGEKQLVAYLVPRNEQALAAGDIREFLKENLPDYMIPSIFVILEALPLTSSGKVNRRALPEPDGARLGGTEEFVAPESTIEKKLAEIWGEVLRVDRISIYDNFFDLGGHSLRTTQVIYRINKAFRMNMPVRRLFEEPTIAGMALAIEEALIEELEKE